MDSTQKLMLQGLQRKVIFFCFHPLEHGGGLEKFYIETAIKLKMTNQSLDILIVNIDNSTCERYWKLKSIITNGKPLKKLNYREDPQKIRALLESKGIRWRKSTLKQLSTVLRDADTLYIKNEVLDLFLLRTFANLDDKTKVIAGVHTAPKYPMKSMYVAMRNFLYNSFIYKLLSKRVDVFHTINTSQTEFLKNQFPKKKVRLIFNPFDSNEFSNLSKLVSPSIKDAISDKKINIAWVGRFTEEKGIEELIRIIESLNSTDYYDKVCWNIAGTGQKADLMKGIQEKWPNVNCFGYIEKKYIPYFLSKNNLFISTSKWEGFPYCLLEAQSLSLPVISFNVSGCNDIIEDGVNGFLAEDVPAFVEALKKSINNMDGFVDVKSFIERKFDSKNLYAQLFDMLLPQM